MPNVMKILKDEITRLSKKQARAVGTPIRKDIAGFRKAIAALRRDVASLQRDVKAYSIEFKKKAAVEPAPVEEGKRVWVFGKGIRALRKKLGLSQEYLAKLIDVSVQSVAAWISARRHWRRSWPHVPSVPVKRSCDWPTWG